MHKSEIIVFDKLKSCLSWREHLIEVQVDPVGLWKIEVVKFMNLMINNHNRADLIDTG